jgi:hypothetical protein
VTAPLDDCTPDPLQAIREDLQRRQTEATHQADQCARLEQLTERLTARLREVVTATCSLLAQGESRNETYFTDIARHLLTFNEALREADREYPRYRILERLGRAARAGVPALDTAASLLLADPSTAVEQLAQALERIAASRPHDVWPMWLTYSLDQLLNSQCPPAKNNVPPDTTRDEWRRAELAFGCILFSDDSFRAMQESMDRAAGLIDDALRGGGYSIPNRPHGRVRDLINAALFNTADEATLLAMLPPIPAWWMPAAAPGADPAEGAEALTVRWQEDREWLDRYYRPPEQRQKKSGLLRGAAAQLIDLLKSYPMAAVQVPVAAGRLAVRYEVAKAEADAPENRSDDAPLVGPAFTAFTPPSGSEPKGKAMADTERPSPFTIPEPAFKFAEGPPAQPPPLRSMSVGGLIHNLIIFADSYEQASADIDRAEPMLKPHAIGNRDANADIMQRDFRATVAIDRVRAYVLGKYGADLTVGTARQLLGDLIRTSLTVDAAEALPLEEAMDKLNLAESSQERSGIAPAIPESPTGFLGGAALADALGVHGTRRDAFFRQLERQRTSLGDDCWHEVHEPRPNSPRFLYRVDSPEMRQLAKAYKDPKPA